MIVFFDGVCGLCNRAVDFLMVRDRARRLQFAPLQGATARTRLPASDIENLNSLVVVDGETILRKSDGILHAISVLGPGWHLIARVATMIPRPLRDLVYDFIARTRYSIFGKRDVCRLPTPGERARFLD